LTRATICLLYGLFVRLLLLILPMMLKQPEETR
jgi:hypothetical protein